MDFSIKKIKRVPRFLYGKTVFLLTSFRRKKIEKKLLIEKSEQLERFEKLRHKFQEKYEEASEGDSFSLFVTKLWGEFNHTVEMELARTVPFDFLRLPTIRKTMFTSAGGKWMRNELAFLEKHLPPNRLNEILKEDGVGNPALLSQKYLSSHTLIHHLYHIMYFEKMTGQKIENSNVIVEWGGGYGSLCRIIQRLKAQPFTYIGIDTPLFSTLQWLFLSTIFGEEKVNFIKKENAQIVQGKINLVPLTRLKTISIPRADLFISTWAISESSAEAQKYVLNRQWFGANHFLIAYQSSDKYLPDAELIGRLAEKDGAITKEISFLPGNYYACK